MISVIKSLFSFQMSQAMTPTTDLNSPMSLMPQFNGEFTTNEQLSLISRIAAASIGSQGTVGGLIIAGIVRSSNLIIINLTNFN